MSQGVFLFNKKQELMDTIPVGELTENYMDASLNGVITGGFTTTDIRDYDQYMYFGVKEENNFWMYKIRSVVKDTNVIRVHGVHMMYDDLQGAIIRDIRPKNQRVNTVLINMLKETDWKPGTVVTSTNFSGNFYYQSVLSSLYELCAKARCEFWPVIKFADGKIVSKSIDVVDMLSDDYGKLFKYGDNLLHVVAETNTDELYTAFIGRGKGEQTLDENGNPTGGYGRKIRFDSIDYRSSKDGVSVHSPIGQDYIEISEATALYGYPNGNARITTVDFDNIEDRKELADATFDYALENCRPKVQLKASGLQYEKVELGETVTIIGQMDIRYKTRVFKIKKDFLREKVVSFEFGDKLVKTMADRLKQGQVAEKEREITEQNYIKAMISMVESSFFNEDGYQYDLKADNEYNLPAGFYSFNRPIDQNPSKVIYFGAGKLMIANSKKSDGSWEFSVAIDGDAINANVIRAGILKGGRVEWDLQNGTFLIGKSTSDYNFFWDGDVLRMRNVDIDLKNVKDYKDLQDSLDSRISQLDNDVTSRLDSYSQEFQIAEGKFNSSISSVRTELANYDTKDEVNAKINAADNGIKTYVTNNFSSISQTDRKIESSVSQVKTDISGSYYTKSQTDSKISQTASSIESKITSLNSRVGSAESSLRQTANEVSSKVSRDGVISAINQSSEYVKIQASKIQLDGDVTLTGDFISKSSGTISSLKDGELRFESEYDNTLGASIGLSKLPGSNTYMTTWSHDYEGSIAIGARTKGVEVDGTRYLSQVEPYILFDMNGNVRELHNDYYFAEMIVNARTAFNRDVEFSQQPSFNNGLWVKNKVFLRSGDLELKDGGITLGQWRIFVDSNGYLAFENEAAYSYYYLNPYLSEKRRL